MLENQITGSGMRRGTEVVVSLTSPREKVWGVLDEINSAGVFLRGLDLNSFDDWVRAVIHDEPFVGLGDLFFPAWRIERIERDESSAAVPSLVQQVEQRTGRKLEELFSPEKVI